jgi:zinc D-Ala-D-Ala dipeptidase
MSLRFLRMLAIPCCLIANAFAQPATHDVLAPSTQILVVTTSDWNAVAGTLQRYERAQAGDQWKAVGDPITVVVGENGLGWGAGVGPSNDASVRGSGDPVKKEGDGKSPAGIFRISKAFGYAAHPQPGWRLPYISLTPAVECVDDPTSKSYNRVVDNTKVTTDWNSSEHMSRIDVYRWGLVVDHNADPVIPGAGSCIFMHIWHGPDQGTAGCTAMPQERLESVIEWLDPARKPLLVQLPLAQYEKLKKRWQLPDLPWAEQR